MSRTLVIGAGMAGLTAARLLTDRGADVLVVDKGRAVGGRMATRRVGDAAFDHGAQHVSARSERFRLAMDEWIAGGAARVWFESASETRADRAIEPRHCGVAGMRRIPEHLAEGLDVRTGTLITGLRPEGDEWVASSPDGELRSDSVVLTAPLPQTIDLLDRAALPVDARLRSVEYDACLAVMATLDGPSGLPDGHLALDGDVAWIADNHHKGVSAVPAVTIHSSPGFAERHLEVQPETWAADLAGQAEAHLGRRPTVVRSHRWRYSMPRTTFDDGAVAVARGLVLAGEVFAGARVEGAFLSGAAAADLIDGAGRLAP